MTEPSPQAQWGLLQATTILCPTGYAIERSTPVAPLPPSQTKRTTLEHEPCDEATRHWIATGHERNEAGT